MPIPSLPQWWRIRGSNSSPLACKAGALPYELIPQQFAEHPIDMLSSCGASIVYLLAEFEPLTIANMLSITTPIGKLFEMIG